MELDRIIHESKNFAELEDSDIEEFLRKRAFNSEHLNLEFKSEFPKKRDGKFDIREICKYIVGFSNEEGGLVIYGVDDCIKSPSATVHTYLHGLLTHPSLEDLSQWAKDRIHPLITSPAIRFFTATGRTVAILKIPVGFNKPYCYRDPQSNAIIYFKKTAGGIAELTPDEVREFHRSQFLEQSRATLKASHTRSPDTQEVSVDEMDRVRKHQLITMPQIENPKDYGFVGIYCQPTGIVQFAIEHLSRFLEENRNKFAEELRYFPSVEVSQHCVSVGYFPRGIRGDLKSTSRIILYDDGFVCFDAQADHLMDKDKHLNPAWLAYEIQRQLQLTKALLRNSPVQRIRFALLLENIEQFSIRFYHPFPRSDSVSPYSGKHDPITREIELSSIHNFDGNERNKAMEVVKGILDEVSRIFGLSRALPGLFGNGDELPYVKGLEGVR